MYVSDRSIVSLAVSAAAAVFLFATTFILSDGAQAEMAANAESPRMAPAWQAPQPPAPMPLEHPAIQPQIEAGDDLAALEAVDIALTQASDGATYVWRRGNGRLVGAVRPTKTFRDADQRMCRHIEMQLRLGTYLRRTEGIACRASDGVWVLEG